MRTVAVSACAALLACAHTRPPRDPVLADLESGYLALRAGKNEDARVLLGRAAADFEDLALDGGALEAAFASDPEKPYRGRPHERVLTVLLVAALDAEANRCDMVPASLKNARYLQAKLTPQDEPPLPLADAIARACDAREPLTLELVGSGPRFAAEGAHRERLRVEPGGGDDIVGRIRIGSGGSADRPRAVSLRATLYDSTDAALLVGGRRFDEVLAERAAFKARAQDSAHAHVRAALDGVARGSRDGTVGANREALVRTAFHGGFALASAGVAALVDARVDDRFVRALPALVRAR